MSLKKTKRPNVILILSDDQGYADFGFNGNPWLETPNLDKLHKEGVTLMDFHTSPMCAPTRAALMSGKYPDRVGVWSTLNGCYIMRKQTKTMANAFKDAGYHTGMFGKWHLGDNYPYRPMDKGFDKVVSFGGGVIGEVPDYWDNDYFNDKYVINGELRDFDGYCTDIWMDEAIKEMERIKNIDDEPFFFYIANNAPHGPYNVHSKYSDKYLEMGLEENRANFYGMIENIDENVGKLKDALKKMDLLDNTILVYFGDNGGTAGINLDEKGFTKDGYNKGLRGKKCDPYEGGHRNSCLISWENGGLKGGYGVRGLSFHMDLFPTLLSLCDIELDDNNSFDGMDISPWLFKKDSVISDRTMIIHNMQLEIPRKYKDYCVLTNQYRYVETGKYMQKSPELFDMTKDEGQKNDILNSNVDLAKKLRANYESFFDEMEEVYNLASRIPLCEKSEPCTKLTCHAWHGSTKMSYNQVHVREGIDDEGHWLVEVKEPGRYRIELRRWPKETDKSLQDSIDEIVNKPFVHDRCKGRVYDIIEAKLETNLDSYTLDTAKNPKAAVFEVDLSEEVSYLKGSFICSDDSKIGAYYAYVEKLFDL